MSIDAKLAALGIDLPTPPASVANYIPYKVAGTMVVISGQLPFDQGHVAYKGKVGLDLSLEEGQAAARLCAINILTQLKAACGGQWDRVKGCLRVGGFVNCQPDYTDQPKVINGASDFMVEIFGDAGRHARAAIGVNALPLGAAVEVEATFIME
jgi:enamine deaminase RidA (YjgF/YER057c/UK114 family)